jgi:hypothetical protein
VHLGLWLCWCTLHATRTRCGIPRLHSLQLPLAGVVRSHPSNIFIHMPEDGAAYSTDRELKARCAAARG